MFRLINIIRKLPKHQKSHNFKINIKKFSEAILKINMNSMEIGI